MKKIALSFAVLGLFGAGCATSSQSSAYLKVEDFGASAHGRTFDVQIENDFQARRAELNLEVAGKRMVAGAKSVPCTYNFLLSVFWFPIAHDPLNVPVTGELEVLADDLVFGYPSPEGSREDSSGAALGFGRRETIRFTQVPATELKQTLESSNIRLKSRGQGQSFSGRVPDRAVELLQKFFDKNKICSSAP